MSPLILPKIEMNASMLQGQWTAPFEIVEVLGGEVNCDKRC